jgi:hypothetical protein
MREISERATTVTLLAKTAVKHGNLLNKEILTGLFRKSTMMKVDIAIRYIVIGIKGGE